ncbi:MAG: hypothetical protein HYW33_01145 [Candidatus Blackburnbacteria bacterium]|nr:hypothetical protein [Candidatus Blackburnbacteria bacterium]
MPKTNKRVIILIDGSNFYFKLKNLELHNLLDFNFSGFLKILVGENREFVSATYYVGKVRTDGTERSRKLQSDQQKLFSHKASVALVAQCSESRLLTGEDVGKFLGKLRVRKQK